MHRWSNVVLLAVFFVALCLQCIGAWQDSQTTDEAVHVSAGLTYWRQQYFLLNPEHPPLIKLLASAPLLFVPKLHLATQPSTTVEQPQWDIGRTLLYDSRSTPYAAQWILFLARIPMILLWAGLGWLIWWWARQRYGDWAGVLSSSLYFLDPNFLGHGHLVTTDVGAAAGYTLVFFLADRFWRQPSRSRMWLLASTFGVVQMIKYSTLLLWVLLPALGVIRLLMKPVSFDKRWWWKMVGTLVTATVLMTWLTYGLEMRSASHDPRVARLWQERSAIVAAGVDQQPNIIRTLTTLSNPNTSLGNFLTSATQWPIPAYSYWRGLASLMSHDYWGHAAFLNGQFSYRGWWYYFPEAFALKTPLVTLAVFILSAWLGFHRWNRNRRWSFDFFLFATPLVAYITWSLTSHINIGLRHIFPIYPLLFILAGSAVRSTGFSWVTRYASRVTLAILLSLGIVTLNAWPNTIGYFNAMAGGTSGGHRYLLDSNLDWNQDAWRLRSYLARQNLSTVHLDLFGSLPVDRLFPQSLPVLSDQEIRSGTKPTGLVIVSAGRLYDVQGYLQWLQSYTPSDRIGSSLLVFDFR